MCNSPVRAYCKRPGDLSRRHNLSKYCEDCVLVLFGHLSFLYLSSMEEEVQTTENRTNKDDLTKNLTKCFERKINTEDFNVKLKNTLPCGTPDPRSILIRIQNYVHGRVLL